MAETKNERALKALPKLEADLDIIAKLDDEPNDVGGLTSEELKAEFDKAGNVIKTFLNETLLPDIEGGAGRPGLVDEKVETHNTSPAAHQDIRSEAAQNKRDADAAIALKLDSATIKSGGIPEINSPETLRSHFYAKRKDTSRSWQFEVSTGSNENIINALGGFPDGHTAAEKWFLYIDLPYTEAGGFVIHAQLEGRTNGKLYRQDQFATLDQNWHTTGWIQIQDVQKHLDNHIADKGNPHGVTYVQTGADKAGAAATAFADANTYAEEQDELVLSAAKLFASDRDAETLTAAKDYADWGDAQVLHDAMDYADKNGGKVKTVNNIGPDAAGNVEVPIPDPDPEVALGNGPYEPGLRVRFPDPTGEEIIIPDVLQDLNGQSAEDTVSQKAIAEAVSNQSAQIALKADTKYVNDNFANAFVGNVSGDVIAVDDVSPIEHRVGCKVESKNLIPYPYKDGPKTVNGITFTPHADGSVTIDGTATGQANFFFVSPISIDCKAGSYTASGIPSGGTGLTYYFRTLATYVDGRNATWDFIGPSTRVYKSDFVVDAFLFTVKAGVSFQGETMKPQFERGSVATPYTPYIPDLSAVLVRRYGKNLYKAPDPGYESVVVGYPTLSAHANGRITITGEASVAGGRDTIVTPTFALPAGDYHVSFKGTKTKALYLVNEQTTANEITAVEGGSFTLSEFTRLHFGANANKVNEVWNEDFYIQIEAGRSKTNYAPYIPVATFVPGPDGTVSGMTSLSPSMTILSNTPGVTISAEYNKDSNKVVGNLQAQIEELKKAVIATGGNV